MDVTTLAASTAGVAAMDAIPVTARVKNQTTITGPKYRLTLAVP